ncbi:MAG: SemiSWEET family transporter [Candidatus Moranbacteria bacterium]|nr:SemiSWEET family transporter [Candidatus Moranbacteria bacterium]
MNIGPFEIMLIASTMLEFNPLFQAIKIIKTKESKDVSVLTYAAILVIGVMWLVYGIKIGSLPLIIGNSIKLFASLCVVIIYFSYKNKNNK